MLKTKELLAKVPGLRPETLNRWVHKGFVQAEKKYIGQKRKAYIWLYDSDQIPMIRERLGKVRVVYATRDGIVQDQPIKEEQAEALSRLLQGPSPISLGHVTPVLNELSKDETVKIVEVLQRRHFAVLDLIVRLKDKIPPEVVDAINWCLHEAYIDIRDILEKAHARNPAVVKTDPRFVFFIDPPDTSEES